MYPASEILKHAALRSNSGPLDPLHVAKEIGVSAADALDWRVVARMNVPPVMSEDGRIATKPAGMLSIMVVGNPCRGLLFCFDRGEARECVRLYPDGVRFAIIEGVRRDELLEHQVTPAPVGRIDVCTCSAPCINSAGWCAMCGGNSRSLGVTVADRMLDLVDRKIAELPLEDQLTLPERPKTADGSEVL